jgi:hypothetical protein
MPLNRQKPLYQPWNHEEFLSDEGVQELAAIERWMYMTLLHAAFFCSTRPYLPHNNSKLWRLAGCENREQWDKHKAKVLRMFEKIREGDRKLLSQKRLVIDWERENNRRQTLANNGRRGGNARSRSEANAVALLQPGSSTEPNQTGPNGTEPNGTELNKTEPDTTTREEETVTNRITDKALEILGTRVYPSDRCWPDIQSLVQVYGPTEVIRAFEDWALTKKGEAISYPLSVFVRIADAALRGTITLKDSPDAKKVIAEMAFISQGTVVPDQSQTLVITRWLKDYTPAEIVAAFRAFYDQCDEFSIKFAGKNFCEKGIPLLDLARRNKLEAAKQKKMMDKISEQMAQEAEQIDRELEEYKRKQQEEELDVPDPF